MKIGIVVDNEYQSDVRVKREVVLLKTFGYEVYVLCLSFMPAYTYAEKGTHITPIYLRKKVKDALYFFMNRIPFYEWWWSRRVKKFIRSNAIDVVHTHDLYMAKCVKKGISASGKNIPMILDLHENYPHAIQSYRWSQGTLRSMLVQPKKWEKKEGQYLRYADALIVLSQDFKEVLLSRHPLLEASRICVFPNVVDTDQFDQFTIDQHVEKHLPMAPRVLYFGMVAQRRGIFRSLEVCAQLMEEGMEFSLVIIGPVDQADRSRFMDEIGKDVFRDRIVYIPWIELSELPSYLHVCDIALAPFDKNPQHESGVANKIFQYMYGKLPIVASNCKPQQELIERYRIGEVFSSDEEFKDKLSNLILDKELRADMGNRAYQTLMSEFHQDAFSSTFKKVYENFTDKT